MFPVRDTIPTRQFPVVNLVIILVNILVFLFQWSLSPESSEWVIRTFGIVPRLYTDPAIRAQGLGAPAYYLPLFTNMFLHGGWLHLIGNVWTLYIFGDNVEDRMGRRRYLAFYLLCGLIAGITHIVFNWNSPIPSIGASGAIAGVMGAYMFMFPGSKILMLFPIFYIPFFFRIPAFVYLGLWFVFQLLDGTSDLFAPEAVGGVAFWAHIGGFAGGVVIYRLFTHSQYDPPETYNSYKRDPDYYFSRKIR